MHSVGYLDMCLVTLMDTLVGVLNDLMWCMEDMV